MTGKYSVIFLHDGGSTRRWRMGPALVRTLLFLLVLVPLVAAASLWLNWRLWQDLNSARGENLALRRQVESNAQTTARLANLERFLRKTDPRGLDQLLPAPSGAGAAPSVPPAASPASLPPLPSTGAVAGSPPPAPPAPDTSPAESGEPRSTTDVPAPEPAAGPAAVPEDQTSAPAPQAPVTNAGDTVNAENVVDAVDTGLARVENLHARRVGARSLRISFDLYNTEQQPQLAGKAAFELLLADGAAYPLDDHGDTTYRINRLKKIVGNPTLPAEVTDTAGASIRVSVFNDDDLIYRVTTPLRP